MFLDVPTRHRRRLIWATPLLLFACMLGFGWLLYIGFSGHGQFLAKWGTLPEALLAPRESWLQGLLDGHLVTLFTALFIHADWLHLGGNLVFLLIFGLASERAIGAGRFLLLFLFCGALANLVAAVSLGDTPDRVIVGSSGAVSAVIGSYLVLFPRARLALVLPLGLYLEFVRIPASLLIAIWALLQVAFTYVGPAFGAVAWWAHLGGFLFGMVFALLIKPGIRRRLRRGG
ncbi:MAG: rhomboid family intramembrane serine protease [Xanthomonadales bacterium]|nr:rhomboid family intramembrane serine protease [Xanthomonadales bacterium]